MDKVKVGEKYGLLTILENHHPKDEVVCKCDCGNIKIARASNVYYGGTRSCGRIHNPGNTKHGYRGKRLYTIWKGMRERCNTPTCSIYHNYGGRGIKICDEWNDFSVFKKWALENGYNDNLTIDRIDVNGNYEPTNCKWSTPKEQANNRRSSHYLTIDGITHTISEWSEISGIKASTIQARINVYKWDAKDAVNKPLRKGGECL